METTMTWTTYLSEPHAVILPSAGAGASAGAALVRHSAVAPTVCAGQGTRMSSFGHSRATLEDLMNKSIAQFPTNDVVGVPGIRSWSPPV